VKLRLAPDFLALFPEALIGVVRVRGCDNSGREPAAASAPAATPSGEIEHELWQAAAAAAARFAGAALAEEPRIACWRDAYRRFGANPKQSPSSLESLLRRVAKAAAGATGAPSAGASAGAFAGGAPPSNFGLRPINPLVDLYNTVSLTHLLPAGGEDLAQVRGDVVLCRAGAAEPPLILLGDAEARPPHPGEVIYRDDVSAICRRWNWREADRTKLTAATRDALLVLEALPPAGRNDLDRALADLAARIARRCGGETAVTVLAATSPELDLDG
jgi:DNA/RNA-binding domain of Phe-tRNA-synthetase-like protein